MESSFIKSTLTSAYDKLNLIKETLAIDDKEKRMEAVEGELSSPEVWKNVEKSTELNQEKSQLAKSLQSFHTLRKDLEDALELIDIADDSLLKELEKQAADLEQSVEKLSFASVFTNKHDKANAYIEIQSGSGGTEAQDWAAMLMRMYLRWCERRSFTAKVEHVSDGEVAGIKHATLLVKGDHAYGWLRTESGVHRLVRKSPFDSGNRRHTSFASIFILPQIDATIEVNIDPKDLRIDTYRASGAGGQHVNKTDSAVRITHLPSKIVVQAQSERSQHQNKENAMRQLTAKLYEKERLEKTAETEALSQQKTDISWGSQIRSYVLDQSRIKDLRTNVEVGNTASVLDGDIDIFIESALRKGV